MDWYQFQTEEVADKLSSSLKTGLSSAEIELRQKENGENTLEKEKKASLTKLFFSQFLNPLIIILLAATILKFSIGGLLDAVVILVTIMIMIVVTLFQEFKAERAMQALKSLAAPQSKVIREGELQVIPSKEVTIGDLIVLEAGDKIPADGRLVTCSNLKVDEAMLSGESIAAEKTVDPIKKETNISDRTNMVFAGTIVMHGKGTYLVTAIGMSTEVGKIAKQLQSQKKIKTPLQKSINHFGNVILIIIFVIVLLFMLIGWKIGIDWSTLVLLCIAIGVAAIPEGLPATVTVVLAAAVQLMSKKRAIVRKLVAVETLGATNVICTDKTGTLTKNAMSVEVLASVDEEVPIGDLNLEPRWETLIEMGALCNDANLKKGVKEKEWIGDPTDIAILKTLDYADRSIDVLTKNFPRQGEIPFSSEKKFMATLNHYRDKTVGIVKGSPELICKMATHWLTKDGKIESMQADDKELLNQQIHQLGEKGFRVLGVAFKDSNPERFEEETLLSDLIFCGLFGLIDPPREETSGAIEKCYRAGIEVVMVTGDHPVTAKAIAQQIKLKGNQVLTGPDLQKMSQEELFKALEQGVHFARIMPEDKLRIVKAYQKAGQIVAMTGDGVNDAPALKSANIGVSMGITGTEVAKEASDIILSDDNFSTIITSVEEGRSVFNRLRNATAFLLTTCFGEVITILASFIGLKLSPLEPLQILWINLITGSMIAIPLGMEPKEGDELKYPPRHHKVGLLFPGMLLRVAFLSLVLAVGAFLIFSYTYEREGLFKARTMTFAGIILFEWLIALQMRSDEKSIWRVGFFSNRMLILFSIGALVLFTALIYIPFFQKSFHTVSLSFRDWLICFIPGIVVTCLEVLRKILFPKLFSYGKWNPRKWSSS